MRTVPYKRMPGQYRDKKTNVPSISILPSIRATVCTVFRTDSSHQTSVLWKNKRWCISRNDTRFIRISSSSVTPVKWKWYDANRLIFNSSRQHLMSAVLVCSMATRTTTVFLVGVMLNCFDTGSSSLAVVDILSVSLCVYLVVYDQLYLWDLLCYLNFFFELYNDLL